MQLSIGAFDPSLLSYPGDSQIRNIKLVVANTFHLSVDDLDNPGRLQRIAFARQVAMYLMCTLTDITLAEIGEAFHRDHSTVVHGRNTIARRIEREPAFAATISRLRGECAERV